ncbi:hypothetical protein [Stenotrophomonas sp. 278]|uniref:hypothetical protein n=1 Tax=Stenotrophomonas sp. 278 TaxID=2479851 RepID=UPI001C8BCE4F|nr:hypothetical protein [Stenotrophomonas sp. 278]
MKAIDRLSDSTTVRLLDRWKAEKGVDSDYRAAKVLAVTPSTISGWRAVKSHAKPSLAAKMAKDIGADELQVLAAIEADRAYNAEDRRIWQKHGRALFVALVLTTTSPVLASPVQTSHLPQSEQSDHYAKWKIGPLPALRPSLDGGVSCQPWHVTATTETPQIPQLSARISPQGRPRFPDLPQRCP